MRIVIDGYNLLKAIPMCRHREVNDPWGARELLIAQLGRYRWLRGHHLTVVFDGWREGYPVQQHGQSYGVQVIYSRRGEQADDVIRRLASHVAHHGVVVTSDRALAGTMERLGADTITSEVFGKRLQAALDGSKGERDDDTADGGGRSIEGHRQKKGPSRRPSRAIRQREQKLRNL